MAGYSAGMTQQPTGREFDIVVVGATGFVGRLICDHLAAAAPADAKIALAGRSLERLHRLQETLPAPADRWPLVVVDTLDEQAVAELAARTTVVLTTVGPYAKYGLPLVTACAAAGTHYVDLTGEVLFHRDSIDAADADAKRTGARIVHSCGFDSIPSDLGVWLTAATAREAGAGELGQTTLHVRSLKGGMSGGTLDSMRTQVDRAKADRALARVAVDPYALSPDRDAEPEPRGRAGRVVLERSGDTGSWSAPFFMGSYNEPLVRRSNALQDWAYGRGFRYREVQDTGRKPQSAIVAGALAVAVPALVAGLAAKPTRLVLDRLLPKPGDGPSEKSRAAGRFAMQIHATTTDQRRVVTTVGAPYDPGYDGTAVMIGQAALALAFDTDRLPDAAGVLTPATGIGQPLVDRLQRNGFQLDSEIS